MLIDTHAHMNDKRLAPQADRLISEMHANGLEAIINVGYDLESSQWSVDCARANNRVFAVIGIHPHDAKCATKGMYDYFASVADDSNVIAFGEIGLDYHYDYSPRDIQKRVFIEQLELADSLKLPVVIHLREAYQDMLEILKENRNIIQNGIVMHCYSGSAEIVENMRFLDCYYSFGGALTFAKGKDKVLSAIPNNRIMLETDCPYMTPVPYRGKTNQPHYVKYVAEKIAEMKGISYEEVANITTENAYEFFNKMTRY